MNLKIIKFPLEKLQNLKILLILKFYFIELFEYRKNNNIKIESTQNFSNRKFVYKNFQYCKFAVNFLYKTFNIVNFFKENIAE